MTFYQHSNQLTTDQGCLLWEKCVIVPEGLQSWLLQELYFTYPGMVKIKLLAHSYMWYIDCHIEDIVKICM